MCEWQESALRTLATFRLMMATPQKGSDRTQTHTRAHTCTHIHIYNRINGLKVKETRTAWKDLLENHGTAEQGGKNVVLAFSVR